MNQLVNSKRVGIPVLITSAINVSASHTLLIDADIRLHLTLKSIDHWRSKAMVSYVIVCDGSGYDLKPYIDNSNLENQKAYCEVISFTNNINKVKSKGKGYGEGEIVKYALQKSLILQNANIFAKCTGKLWVENFSECLNSFKQFAVFDIQGWLKIKAIDTRFYIVNKNFYIKYIADLHQNVDDDDGYYLEHAFRDGLKRFKPSEYIMFPTPKVIGVSGSSGSIYKSQRIKSMLRDIRSFILKIWG